MEVAVNCLRTDCDISAMAVDSCQTVVGRTFSLGLLYDCNTLIPVLTYWDQKALQEVAEEIPQTNSDQTEASLKASVLCGLVGVEDSHQTRKSSEPTKLESKQAPEVTHILYAAFFESECEASEKEGQQEQKGKLKERSETEGQDSLRRTANVYKVSGYKDFNLKESNQSLCKRVITNIDNAVPQNVWWKQLKTKDAGHLVQQMENKLIKDAEQVYKGLKDLENRWKKIEKCAPTQILNNNDLMQLVLHSQKKLKKILTETCTQLKDQCLIKILKMLCSLPDLKGLMDHKEEEINILRSLIEKNPKIEIIPSGCSLSHNKYKSTVGLVLPFLDKTTRQDNLPYTFNVKEQWLISDEVKDKVLEKVKLFADLAEANKNNSISFQISVIEDVQKGATLYLYQDNYKRFEPPSKPKIVRQSDITHNSVTLNIYPSQFKRSTVTNYTVESCVHGGSEWNQEMCECKDRDVIVSGLKANEKYQFRCRAECAVGLGPASEPSTLITTLPCSPPEKLQVECDSTYLSVSWEEPSELGHGVKIKNYTLEYAETFQVQKQKPTWNKLIFKANKIMTNVVQPSKPYTVKVRCDCGDAGLSKESVKEWTNKQEYGIQNIKKKSNLIAHGPPEVFQLPINYTEEDGSQSYTFGRDSPKENRKVIFLGATGSGKSTLINGMINYILGIDWKDSFRFKLIDEVQLKSQAESQTTHVTTYKVNHQDYFKIPYSLTLIDTPGFGNTSGIARDHEIIEQIRRLFTSAKGGCEIDAVCFVTQASRARLTVSQNYIFDSVLSIFGKDLAEKICTLVTFADNQLPPVLNAINASKVQCRKTSKGQPVHFKFNNSALFADNRSVRDRADDEDMEVDNVDAIFWEMGAQNMNKFFTALEKNELHC